MKCILVIVALVTCLLVGAASGQQIHSDNNYRNDGVNSLLDTCNELKLWESITPANSQEAQEQYDSLRLYIERCAASDTMSFQAFLHLNGAVQLLPETDTNRFTQYRDWLISVLYLNTTVPVYYCACLYSIAFTYQNGYKNYPPTIAYLGVLSYIWNTQPCKDLSTGREFTQDSLYAISKGYDPTHLPPIDSLGLGFLDSTQSSVHTTSNPLSSTYLASFTSNPNPFKDETTLSFVLNRMTYTTVEVFDVLGRKVWGDDHGYSLDPGLHTVHIDGASLPSGTLYARVSTGFGEVQTVKLIKN